MTTTDTIGTPSPDVPSARRSKAAATESANRVFSTSILISAVRCTLAYVVFPWLLPALGLAQGVGPELGLVIGVVAIGFNIASIRRFWAADHHWKIPISILNCCVIGMLTVLVFTDLRDVLG